MSEEKDKNLSDKNTGSTPVALGTTDVKSNFLKKKIEWYPLKYLPVFIVARVLMFVPIEIYFYFLYFYLFLLYISSFIAGYKTTKKYKKGILDSLLNGFYLSLMSLLLLNLFNPLYLLFSFLGSQPLIEFIIPSILISLFGGIIGVILRRRADVCDTPLSIKFSGNYKKKSFLFIGSFFILLLFILIYFSVNKKNISLKNHSCDNVAHMMYDNEYRFKDTSVYGKRGGEIFFMNWGESGSRCIKIENADADTFKVLDLHYATDKNNVYYYDLNGGVIDADPSTFELIGYGWAKDKNNVYNNNIKIAGADSQTFIVMDSDYQKDKNFVFLHRNIVAKADPQTFQVLGCDYAKDKNYVYYGYNGHRIANADAITFEIIGDKYHCSVAKDKNNVYKQGKVLEDAKPEDYKSDIKPKSDNIIDGINIVFEKSIFNSGEIINFNLKLDSKKYISPCFKIKKYEGDQWIELGYWYLDSDQYKCYKDNSFPKKEEYDSEIKFTWDQYVATDPFITKSNYEKQIVEPGKYQILILYANDLSEIDFSRVIAKHIIINNEK